MTTERTDDYTILRVGKRLAMVTPLGQFFYLTSEPDARAATLDAMTFANPKVREILDREDEYISHEELMRRLGRP